MIRGFPATQTVLDRIREEQDGDYVCSYLKQFSASNWPNKSRLPEGRLPYYQHRCEISVCGDYVLFGSRLIIPPALQLEMLNKLHEGHFGLSKCRNRAKQSIWWLGLSSQLTHLIENCPKCVEERKNTSQPFVKENFPDRPWQKVGVDLFKFEKWYLVMTDYYSRFFEIVELKSMQEAEVVAICKGIFARYGIPEVVRSDNGTQFASGFKAFAKEYDFQHFTSSPKFPQSNGAAEAALKIAKNIIKKCDDICLGLLSYRSTPLENGYSPAELMFSRKIRSRVPVVPRDLGTFKNHDLVATHEKDRKDGQERMNNKRHRVSKLSELSVGSMVWIIDMRVYGEVIKADDTPNSFIIKTEKGNSIRRNRWHLVPALYKHKLNVQTDDVPVIPDDYESAVQAPKPIVNNGEHDGNGQNCNGPPNRQINHPPIPQGEHPLKDVLRRSKRNRGPPERLNL